MHLVANMHSKIRHRRGITALICSARNANPEVMSLLIDARADVNHNANGTTALIAAAEPLKAASSSSGRP